MEIKEGEFVRTIKGTIAKIEEKEFEIKYKITNMQPRYLHCLGNNKFQFEDIVKHSNNIIDLIEIKDLVFIEETNGFCDFIYINDVEMLEALKEDVRNGIKIKEILTHEQYIQNCYKLEKGE